MQTRTYPRTMQQAFGPYTNNTLYEPDHSDTANKWVITIWIAVVAVLSAIALIGSFQ